VRKKSLFKKLVLGLAGLIVIGIIFIIATIAIAGEKIFSGANTDSTFLTIGNLEEPKADFGSGGRINILILGRGGANHPGGLLTDTIQLISINPSEPSLAMLAIPRDLAINLPGDGFNKINTAYSLGEQKKKGSGGAFAKKVVSDLLDIPIHYYIDLDFTGFIKIINTLGGVTINVEKGFYDPEFPAPDMRGYQPFSVKAGVQRMNGETALKYARSRHGDNGEGSDFARAKRQQQVIKAVLSEALKAENLLNPAKMLSIINTLGNHLNTDMNIGEVERIAKIVKNISSEKMSQKSLDNTSDGLLVNNSSLGLGYALVPRAGLNNYLEIQMEVHRFLEDPLVKKESPTLLIKNLSGNSYAGKDFEKIISAYGFEVLSVEEGSQVQAKSEIRDYSKNKKNYSLNVLKKRLGVSAKSESAPSEADFVVILGKDYKLFLPSYLRSQTREASPSPTPKSSKSNKE
jgi:LCP family protein required for cell wall assembly